MVDDIDDPVAHATWPADHWPAGYAVTATHHRGQHGWTARAVHLASGQHVTASAPELQRAAEYALTTLRQRIE